MNNSSFYSYITCIVAFLLGGCTQKRIPNKALVSASNPEVEIEKRLPSGNENLTYNKYRDCIKDWKNHVRENIVYPETSNLEYMEGYVPMLFRINPDSTIYDIAINEAPKVKWSGTLITDPSFQIEALRLLRSSGKWSPFLNNGEYLNREAIATIHFNYHKIYFDPSEESLVLNPDVKAKFTGEQKLYERLVNNKLGCDGIVDVIFIIEKSGKISNVECLNAQGKTNCSVGLRAFSKLVPWEAAIKDGKKVRTQMKFSIHT